VRSSCAAYESSRTGVGGKKDGHRRVRRSGRVESIQDKICFYSSNSIVYYSNVGTWSRCIFVSDNGYLSLI